MPQQQAGAWNVANALTGLRLALVPVFWVLLLHDGGGRAPWRIAAFVAFAVASITDRYDGELARRRGLVTDVGKIADPIADKALIGAGLIGLALLGEVSWWICAVVLVREVAVTALRFVVLRHGVIAASQGGKAKTLLQAVAIGLYVLPLAGLPHQLARAVLFVAVIVTVVTGVDYLVRAVQLRRASERTTRNARSAAADPQ